MVRDRRGRYGRAAMAVALLVALAACGEHPAGPGAPPEFAPADQVMLAFPEAVGVSPWQVNVNAAFPVANDHVLEADSTCHVRIESGGWFPTSGYMTIWPTYQDTTLPPAANRWLPWGVSFPFPVDIIALDKLYSRRGWNFDFKERGVTTFIARIEVDLMSPQRHVVQRWNYFQCRGAR